MFCFRFHTNCITGKSQSFVNVKEVKKFKNHQKLYVAVVVEEINELPINHQTMDAGVVTKFGY